MEISGARRMGTVVEAPEIRTTERAVCELCGDVILTVNGGRHGGSVFLPFERLLDLHMEHQHGNVCVLPAQNGLRRAA